MNIFSTKSSLCGLGFILQLSANVAMASDIKPALPVDSLDDEQLRLAQVIHKRIVDYQGIKSDTNAGKVEAFKAYTETLKTGAQFKMLPVKAGGFEWRGSEDGDVVEVELSAFWMGMHEVTWEEYEPFMLSEIPRQKNGEVLEFMREHINNDIDFIARPTPPYHPMTYGMARDGHPAVSMTQHAANKYCQWLSFQTGHFYRLPTEAEWEYVCRAGEKPRVPTGEGAWLNGGEGSHYQKPGLKAPNAWGFYDMHGNVLEWTLDQWVPNRKSHFAKDKLVNPWARATQPYPHVAKGGHWKHSAEEASAAARHQSSEDWKKSDPQIPKSQWYHTDTPWLGFRVLRPAKIPSAIEMYHYWNSGVEEDE